jgi:type II secretory pathway pseudopilin PulG
MNRHARTSRGAFTLVELLTIIIILGILVTILAPSLTKYRQVGMIKMTQATINSLELGCMLYRDDFSGVFPPSRDTNYNSGGDGRSPGTPWRGSQLLALYLQGYGPNPGSPGIPTADLSADDGKEGPGFRVAPRGKVFGPYADADKLPFTGKFDDPRNASQPTTVPRFFVDAFDRPIVYYRFTGTAYDPADNGIEGYVVGSPAQSAANSDQPTPGPTRAGSPCWGMIDKDPWNGPGYSKNYGVGGSKYRRTDFLLLSRGPNGTYATGGDIASSDDVTNMFPNQ